MQLSTLFFLATATLALANPAPQAASVSPSTTATPAVTTTFSLSPVATCLASCKVGDVNCQAACIGSAHPNSVQVSQTNECAAKCNQGNGTLTENQGYKQCIVDCIASYYPTSQTVVAAGAGTGTAGTAGTVTGTIVKSSGTAGSATVNPSSSGTATGTAAASTSSKAAANANIKSSVLGAGGIAGMVLAVLAL